MQKLKVTARQLYKHHVIRYLLVGGTTVVLDFCLLVFMHSFLHIDLAIATSVAYWLAISYNFVLNRWWTFNAAENNSLRKHLMPYVLLLGFNYLFAVLFVGFASRIMPYEIAKLITVPIQMTWTYPLFRKIFMPVAKGSSKSA